MRHRRTSDPFFSSYNKLLEDGDYVTKRQAGPDGLMWVKLCDESLGGRENLGFFNRSLFNYGRNVLVE